MVFSKQTLNSRPVGWLLPILTLIILAAQCNTPPTPVLPTPPTRPVVRIALLAPAEGDMATFGRMMRNGSIMAFDAWNEQGGLLGHHIEGAVYNTECQFDSAGQAIQQALDDGLTFIIGPLCSEAAIAAAQLAESEKVVMISPTATHPLVTVNHQGQTRSTIFRASYTYPLQGQAAARFAYERLKTDKAALFSHPGDDYATALSDAFAKQFSIQGGEIVYRASYTPGETDFKERLMAIRRAGAELIYLPAPVSVVNRVASQLKELDRSSSADASGTRPILLGSDRWQSTELDLAATTGSYFTTHFVSEEPRPIVQSWTEVYQATYAVEPNTLAALGYDAAMMLMTAIEQAGTFETMAVVKSLEQETFRGVTGQIAFDGQHNPIKPVPVVRIEDGQITFFTSMKVHELF